MWQTGAGSHKYSIKAQLIHQLIYGIKPAYNAVHFNGNTHLLEVFHFALNNLVLWQTEFRNAIGKHTTSHMQGLKNGYLVSLTGQITGTSQSSRTSTYHGHLLGIRCKLDWLDFLILVQLIISYKALQTANSYGLTLMGQYTVLFTLVFLWAYPTTYCRQGAGLLDNVNGTVIIPFLDFADKGRNIDIYRTAGPALRIFTCQTAIRLSYSGFLIIAQSNLLKITGTDLRVLLWHFMFLQN